MDSDSSHRDSSSVPFGAGAEDSTKIEITLVRVISSEHGVFAGLDNDISFERLLERPPRMNYGESVFVSTTDQKTVGWEVSQVTGSKVTALKITSMQQRGALIQAIILNHEQALYRTIELLNLPPPAF